VSRGGKAQQAAKRKSSKCDGTCSLTSFPDV